MAEVWAVVEDRRTMRDAVARAMCDAAIIALHHRLLALEALAAMDARAARRERALYIKWRGVAADLAARRRRTGTEALP